MTFTTRMPLLLAELQNFAQAAQNTVADHMILYNQSFRVDVDHFDQDFIQMVKRDLGVSRAKARIACYQRDNFVMLCEKYHSEMIMLLSAHHDCWVREKDLKLYAEEMGWDVNKGCTVQSVGRLEYVQDVFGFRADCNKILERYAIDPTVDATPYDYILDPVKTFRIQRLNIAETVNYPTGIYDEECYSGMGTRQVGRSVIMSVRWTRLLKDANVAYVLNDPFMGDTWVNDCTEQQFISRFGQGEANEFGYMWGQDW
jgi:hypothetical protein